MSETYHISAFVKRLFDFTVVCFQSFGLCLCCQRHSRLLLIDSLLIYNLFLWEHHAFWTYIKTNEIYNWYFNKNSENNIKKQMLMMFSWLLIVICVEFIRSRKRESLFQLKYIVPFVSLLVFGLKLQFSASKCCPYLVISSDFFWRTNIKQSLKISTTFYLFKDCKHIFSVCF